MFASSFQPHKRHSTVLSVVTRILTPYLFACNTVPNSFDKIYKNIEFSSIKMHKSLVHLQLPVGPL